MHGPAQRLIRQRGTEYTVRNASGGSGGRDTPSYSDDGTLTAVLERQSRTPAVVTTSGGEDVESDLELRAVDDASTTTIVEAGQSDYPTKLVHPEGQTYRVLATYPEDSGVTVIAVERA
jgi:hypothetical protein